MVSLTGTGQSQKYASYGGSLDVLCPKVGKHTMWKWPTSARRLDQQRKTGANVSTGCMVALKTQLFPRRRFVRAWSPPKQLQGRGGAVRYMWNGKYDICSITVYSFFWFQIMTRKEGIFRNWWTGRGRC